MALRLQRARSNNLQFVLEKQADFLFVGFDAQWTARLKPFPLRLTVPSTELVQLKPGRNWFVPAKPPVPEVFAGVRFQRDIDIAAGNEAVLVFFHFPQDLAARGVDLQQERQTRAGRLL